jgi:Icc protein
MRRHGVLMVDMGHTHYNELANDGHTIYAATRSTGQIEEGPVGFSIANIDRGVVSWKFKTLGAPLPFVMITSPADRPLIVDAARTDQLVRGTVQIRAKIFDGSAPVARVTCHIDGAAARPMTRIGETSVWQCEWNAIDAKDGEHQVTVRAATAGGEGDDTIEVLTSQSGNYKDVERCHGDDANAIGAHEIKHILGTQLGPNKNGRKW